MIDYLTDDIAHVEERGRENTCFPVEESRTKSVENRGFLKSDSVAMTGAIMAMFRISILVGKRKEPVGSIERLLKQII